MSIFNSEKESSGLKEFLLILTSILLGVIVLVFLIGFAADNRPMSEYLKGTIQWILEFFQRLTH